MWSPNSRKWIRKPTMASELSQTSYDRPSVSSIYVLGEIYFTHYLFHPNGATAFALYATCLSTSFWQSGTGQSQYNAACSAGWPPLTYPLWSCGQSCSAVIREDIVHWHMYGEDFPDGTLHCFYSVFYGPSRNYLEHKVQSDPLAVLKSRSYNKISSEDAQDNNNWMPLFRAISPVATPLSTEALVSSLTSNTGHILVATQASLMPDWMVLQDLGTLGILLHIPASIQIANYAKKSTTFSRSLSGQDWLSCRYCRFGPSCTQPREK